MIEYVFPSLIFKSKIASASDLETMGKDDL
jgi:hypothetical protein